MKRFVMALFPLLLTPALACTPAQLAQQARSAARQEVQSKLGVAAFVYQFAYSNVRHSVDIGQPSIRGKGATVRGTLTIKATEKSSGKAVQGTYKGTVTLSRVGTCGWKVTGYRQG